MCVLNRRREATLYQHSLGREASWKRLEIRPWVIRQASFLRTEPNGARVDMVYRMSLFYAQGNSRSTWSGCDYGPYPVLGMLTRDWSYFSMPVAGQR